VVVLIVLLLTYAVFYLLPAGDPALRFAGKSPTPESLALIRHRLSPGFPALPAVIGTLRRDFASAIADILEALADGLGAGAPPIPDLPARLAALDAAIQSVDEEPALYDSSPAARVAERDHVAIARDLLQQVAALAEAVDAARALRAP